METLDPDTQHSFRRDFELAQEAVRSGVTAQRAASADTHWELWSTFCHELALDSLLSNLQDPVALLQVFAHRYRTGTIAPKHKPVHSRTVEDALRSVGQTFAGLGQPDPRLTSTGNIDFRIQRMLSSDTDIIHLVGRWRSKCFDTSTSKPNLPCVASLHACSNMDPSFSFRITTSHASNLYSHPRCFSHHVSMFHVSMLATPPYPIHDGFPSSVERLEALPPA